MSDSISPPKETQRERLWPYAVIGTILLIVFVAAILIPDYLNYRLRLAGIEAASKMAANNSTPTSSTSATNNKTEPSNAPLPTQPPSKTEPANLVSASAEPKSSEIFETYGRLLTMLLAFVSVLGVFFGYFVRKSLREVEEDTRRQLRQTIAFWEKEKNLLSSEVTTKLAEVRTQQAEVEKMITSSKQVLEVLQTSAKAEAQKPPSEAGLAATAVAAIDADISIPAPPRGE